MILYSIGYEGLKFEQFLEILIKNQIEIVVDVRQISFSWKKDFNKKILKDKLNFWGIEYIHFPKLGTPKNIRNIYKRTKDFSILRESFIEHLENNIDILQEFIDFLKKNKNKNIALLCFEKNPLECHRLLILEKLLDLEIIDGFKDLRIKIPGESKIFCSGKNLSNTE